MTLFDPKYPGRHVAARDRDSRHVTSGQIYLKQGELNMFNCFFKVEKSKKAPFYLVAPRVVSAIFGPNFRQTVRHVTK